MHERYVFFIGFRYLLCVIAQIIFCENEPFNPNPLIDMSQDGALMTSGRHFLDT